jgi:proline racemase
MSSFFSGLTQWMAPTDWIKIHTIDAHTAGEPLRIITDGFPDLPGKTILEKRQAAKKHYDNLRRLLMWEPRGHADMYGCILLPPVSKDSDFGVLFTHNEGFSTMCGHGIIAVTKVVLETGLLPIKDPLTVIRIDTPAGPVTAYATSENQKVSSIAFENVPSFVLMNDMRVEIKDYGSVCFDIAFGGAFYAFVSAEDLSLECTPNNMQQLIRVGMLIKNAIMKKYSIQHPFEKNLSFLYGTIFIAPPLNKKNHSRNVCIFAEGEVDRSPTGTGVSARMALHFDRNEVSMNQTVVIESIIGTTFKSSISRTEKYGPYNAVIPRVEGTAFITGKHEFLIDPQDVLRNGFLLR